MTTGFFAPGEFHRAPPDEKAEGKRDVTLLITRYYQGEMLGLVSYESRYDHR